MTPQLSTTRHVQYATLLLSNTPFPLGTPANLHLPPTRVMQMFFAMEKGQHISPQHPCVTWHRVRAFRIEPLKSGGKLTVDGELVDYVPLQQHVWRKAANLMCSPDQISPD